jgi:hypothetical protein
MCILVYFGGTTQLRYYIHEPYNHFFFMPPQLHTSTIFFFTSRPTSSWRKSNRARTFELTPKPFHTYPSCRLSSRLEAEPWAADSEER